MTVRAPASLLTRLDVCVRSLTPDIVQFTSELVDVASENRPGTGYAQCVKVIESRLRLLACRSSVFPIGPAAWRRRGIEVEVETLQEGRPYGVSETTPLGRVLRDQVRAVTGRAPRFEMCPGLLEIRFYAGRNIPAYAYGPGPLAVSHGPKEFVTIDRLVECSAIYARTQPRCSRRDEFP